ncbi:phosphatase PAP2 family protein [Henriciella aquimarina]|uniref:phosphatase PAP2 family protein n=1 Tax=Henriciella aquimarina TaxID=545261 RepID=UPI001301E6AB|nr:phosphatase PAP2 family protein [Henriciella aquimarina]
MALATQETAQLRPARLAAFADDFRFLKLTLPLVIAYFVAAFVYKHFVGTVVSDGPLSAGEKFVGAFRFIQFMALFFLSTAAIQLLLKAAEGGKAFSLETHLRRLAPRLPAVPVMFAIGIFTFAVFIYAYALFKARIPEVHPFGLDQLFASMDAAMFGGRQAWEYFTWVYDIPGLINVIDFNYSLWVALFQCSFVYCFITRSEPLERRVRYIYALIFTQIIGGTILALMLSSVGPVYYGHIVEGVNPYAPQLELLADAGRLNATNYQTLLWADYSLPGVGQLGISAMPSLHCAVTTLFLLMFTRSLMMKVLVGLFAVSIFFGSFLLAWHYVVDGILDVAVGYGCWQLAGWASRKVTAEA